MKNKILFLFLFILLCFSVSVKASPAVSFTATSVESKTVLAPSMNTDVDEYKWSIIGKRDGYNLETGWIPYADRANHITVLETGTYFVTITGRNTDTDETTSFTNQVKVTVHEDYVKPEDTKVEEESIGSRIINALPEPLKTFFSERNSLELGFIVICFLLVIAFVTRRKKIEKFLELERYEK